MSKESGTISGRYPSENNLVSDEVLRKVSAYHLLEAQISNLTTRLNGIPEFKRDPGTKVNAYVDSLINRRADLLKRLRHVPKASSDIRPQRSHPTMVAACRALRASNPMSC